MGALEEIVKLKSNKIKPEYKEILKFYNELSRDPLFLEFKRLTESSNNQGLPNLTGSASPKKAKSGIGEIKRSSRKRK